MDVMREDRAPDVPDEAEDEAVERTGREPRAEPTPSRRAQAVPAAPPARGSRDVSARASHPPQGTPAVVALLDDAGRQARSGSLDAAARSLERALNIEQRNAVIWSQLAEVRLQQRLADQAEAMAKKSNTFAGRNNRLRARNWRIISRARQLAGNAAGAAEAEQQAAMLEAGAR
jgi:predicted negative regulator of RcsB-dependent stress response